MPGVIELNNVSYIAEGTRRVKNITFEFEEGKTTALIGPSGGGKSTLLKLSAGLFAPTEGEVLFRGRNIARMGRTENLAFRREAAMVFQDSALWANQNLFQILELPLQVHFPAMTRQERERRIESTVAAVGYKKDLGIRPAQLSMGEQKLLAFARAMICHPRLLYLDEWTESLDQSAAERLMDLVNKLKGEGVTIILVTHNIQVIHNLADIVIMILGGQIFLRITREQMDNDVDLRRYIEKGMES